MSILSTTPTKQSKKIGFWLYGLGVLVVLSLMFGEPSKPSAPTSTISHAEKAKQAEQVALQNAAKAAERASSDARLFAISYGQTAVQNTLRDPDSVQWIAKAVNLDNGALCYQFRAKNGFGGYAEDAVAIHKGKLHSSVAQWNKLCGGGSNFERY